MLVVWLICGHVTRFPGRWRHGVAVLTSVTVSVYMWHLPNVISDVIIDVYMAAYKNLYPDISPRYIPPDISPGHFPSLFIWRRLFPQGRSFRVRSTGQCQFSNFRVIVRVRVRVGVRVSVYTQTSYLNITIHSSHYVNSRGECPTWGGKVYGGNVPWGKCLKVQESMQHSLTLMRRWDPDCNPNRHFCNIFRVHFTLLLT